MHSVTVTVRTVSLPTYPSSWSASLVARGRLSQTLVGSPVAFSSGSASPALGLFLVRGLVSLPGAWYVVYPGDIVLVWSALFAGLWFALSCRICDDSVTTPG